MSAYIKYNKFIPPIGNCCFATFVRIPRIGNYPGDYYRLVHTNNRDCGSGWTWAPLNPCCKKMTLKKYLRRSYKYEKNGFTVLGGTNVFVGRTRVQMEWIASATISVFDHRQWTLFEFVAAHSAKSLETNHCNTICNAV